MTELNKIHENQHYVFRNDISDEELINKYKIYLDLLKNTVEDTPDNTQVIINNDSYELSDYIREIIFKDTNYDILLKSFATLHHWLHADSGCYVQFIIYYRDNSWFKYSTNNPFPINHQLAEMISEKKLEKLIKTNLCNLQKKTIIQNLLRNTIDNKDLEHLQIMQYHLKYFTEHLNNETEFYRKLIVLLKYVFELKNNYFAI